MAGAQTTLALQDRLTGPLQKMIRAMDSTIKVMEQMDSTTNTLDQKSLANARKNITNASADFERLSVAMNHTGENAQKAATDVGRIGGEGFKILEAAKSAEQASKSIETITNSSSQAAVQQKKLNSALNNSPSSQRMQEVAKVMETTATSTEKATNRQYVYSKSLNTIRPPNSLERLANLFNRVGKTTDSTTAKQTKFNAVLQQVRPSNVLERLRHIMKKVGDSADRSSQQQDKFNQSVNGGLPGIQSLAAGILSAVGAYKALGAAKSFLGDMFSQGINFHAFRQASEVAFTTFLGDAKTAKKYMDDMYAFALTTPFAYPDLLESSRNLIAFGIEAENTFSIMQAVGDAVAAIGGSNADISNAADIFGQIQAQGRITAMEVNRLANFGVNAYEMLGKAAGVSANEMKDQISKGAVGAGQAIAGLVEGMDEKFGGLMEGVKGTWAGYIDSMKSSIRNAGKDMMEDLMIPEGPLVTMVQNITNLIRKIPEHIGPAVAAFIPLIDMLNNTLDSGKLDKFFSVFSGSIVFIANLLSWLGQLFLWVAEVISDNWSWIAPILTAIGAVLAAIISILIVKYTIIGLIRAATMAWAAAQWLVNAAYLANPIGLILLTIVAVIALIIYAMIAWSEQTAAVIGAIVGSIYWLGAVFYNVLMGIGNFGIMVAEWFVNIWNQAIYFLQLAWFGLNVAIRFILDAIANGALTVAEFFANVWNKAVFGVQNGFYKMQEGILTVMSSVASGVTGVVNGALSVLSTLINAAVSGINSLIKLINKIPGVNLDEIGDVDLKASTAAVDKLDSMKANLTAPTEAGPVSFDRVNMAGDYAANANMPTAPQATSFDRLDYKDTGAAFDKGYNAGSNLSMKASDKLTSAIDNVTGLFGGNANGPGSPPPIYEPTAFDPSLGAGSEAPGAAGKMPKGAAAKVPKGASNPTGGKLDSIGKIDDEINIADEDLKLLLELADIRSIQNFKTLNPTVNLTGDMTIREEADIDKIVKKINKNFEDQMGESAEGVYA